MEWNYHSLHGYIPYVPAVSELIFHAFGDIVKTYTIIY